MQASPAAASTEILDPTDALEGLTSRQQLFVSLVFSGLNSSEAYRRSGDCSRMTDQTIGHRAREMLHYPKVQAKLRALKDRREQQTSLAPILTPEWVTTRLMHLAESAEKETVRVTSLIALGKVAGIDLFRETTRVERVERSVEDVDRELKERLRLLQPVIDGESRQVPAAPPAQTSRKRKPIK